MTRSIERWARGTSGGRKSGLRQAGNIGSCAAMPSIGRLAVVLRSSGHRKGSRPRPSRFRDARRHDDPRSGQLSQRPQAPRQRRETESVGTGSGSTMRWHRRVWSWSGRRRDQLPSNSGVAPVTRTQRRQPRRSHTSGATLTPPWGGPWVQS